MNRAIYVNDEQGWRSSIRTLGQDNHAVTVWKIRSDAEAAEDARVISEAFDAGKLAPSHIPQPVVDAAFIVAQQSGRFKVSNEKGLRTAPTAFGGHNYPLTGLHADMHIDDEGVPRTAAFKCLYVGAGTVAAYFRLLPVEFMRATVDERDEMLGDRYEENLASCTKMAMTQTAEVEFLRVEAPAGTILAFPAAGDPARNVAAAEHEVRSLTEYRVTIPFEDYLFRTAMRGLSSAA